MKEIRIPPQPLTPLYMAQRCVTEVDERMSRKIYDVLR